MTSKTRTGFTILQDILTHLDTRAAGRPRSQQVENDLVFLWEAMGIGMAECKRSLTKNEALFMLDLLKDCTWSGRIGLWIGGGLELEVENHFKFTAKDQKWDVEKNRILAKVNAMSSLAKLALLDWVLHPPMDAHTAPMELVKDFQD